MAVMALAGTIAHVELRGRLQGHLLLHALAAFATSAVLWAGGKTMADALHVGALVTVCLAIARIDLAKLIIPDALVLALAALAVTVPTHPPLQDQLTAAVIMGAMFLGVRLGYRALRGVEGLGLGDVKLAAVIGASLGLDTAMLATGVAAALTAVWTAAPVLSTGRRTGTPVTLRTQTPFGVGLAAALAASTVLAASVR